MPESSVTSPTRAQRGTAGARERKRRAEALRDHRADQRAREMAAAGEVAYLRAQLQLAARLTARLAATNDIAEIARLAVDDLHETFAFYLVAIQRLDDETLCLVAGRGPLIDVMTEFLLVEQSLYEGVNGRVARSGRTVSLSVARPQVLCDAIGPATVRVTFARAAGLGNPKRAGAYAITVGHGGQTARGAFVVR